MFYLCWEFQPSQGTGVLSVFSVTVLINCVVNVVGQTNPIHTLFMLFINTL